MIHCDLEKRELRLSVGDLVRHGAATVIRPTGVVRQRLAAGSREHRAWQEEAEDELEDFRSEVFLRHELRLGDFDVQLEGRIDGLYSEAERRVVEEVKTVIVSPEDFEAASLRRAVLEEGAWADYRFQLEIYLLMLAHDSDAPSGALLGRLRFRNLAARETEDITVDLEASAELLDRIDAKVRERLEGILAEFHSREERRRDVARAATSLPFPFPSYRSHQEELSAAARQAVEQGERLLLSAPPGIGKTAAVLHAALTEGLETGRRVFWLTAKTTQQEVVSRTLECILERMSPSPGAAPFRAVFLRAREKICPTLDEGGVVFCHDQHCRFARGYAKKLRSSGLREQLLELPVIAPETIYERGSAAEVCPHELSLDLALESDLIVGDYNYVFDPSSALRRFSLETLTREAILVIDEAHNLYSRARQYYSPSLERRSLEAFGDWIVGSGEAGDTARRESLMVLAEQYASFFPPSAADTSRVSASTSREDEALAVDIDGESFVELDHDLERQRLEFLLEGGHFTTSENALERLSRESRRFAAVLDMAGGELPLRSVHDLRTGALRLVCLDPSRPLSVQLERFHAVIAMSATLEPVDFYRSVLGLGKDAISRVFPSPFPPENRRILVDSGFATTYRKRSSETGRIVETVDAIARVREGNYLVFLPSRAYLREVVAKIDPLRLERDVYIQKARMSEAARDALLDKLRQERGLILYALQGGIFAEGVDYPGDMASGVIVVGPGLPRFDYETQLIRGHFDAEYQSGFEYAYLYPGMHRVLQSAGRVIRSATDTGVIVLLGERFANSQYSRLFPADWYTQSPAELITDDLIGDIEAFWKSVDNR